MVVVVVEILKQRVVVVEDIDARMIGWLLLMSELQHLVMPEEERVEASESNFGDMEEQHHCDSY
jgi:hypothetical protein